MNLNRINQKKAAIELSIGTVVIIVLAMTMLILGLVLVRNIFGGATESVDTLNDKVRQEITNLFTAEGTKIAIRLGADKIGRVKQGDRLGIGVGAETRDGGAVAADGSNLRYYVEKTNSGADCDGISILDHEFVNRRSPASGHHKFEEARDSRGYVILFFDVRSDAPECTQRLKITTVDTTGTITFTSFRVQIIRKGIFS